MYFIEKKYNYVNEWEECVFKGTKEALFGTTMFPSSNKQKNVVHKNLFMLRYELIDSTSHLCYILYWMRFWGGSYVLLSRNFNILFYCSHDKWESMFFTYFFIENMTHC